ncbi:zinc-ribbon domain containing protein [Actinoallomurus oryzae]|uniref:zinc-ribbon domain containing protein n=1 Tax=Actinoallomurus oryzae TaxID=502180 RepID=UPI0031F026F9
MRPAAVGGTLCRTGEQPGDATDDDRVRGRRPLQARRPRSDPEESRPVPPAGADRWKGRDVTPKPRKPGTGRPGEAAGGRDGGVRWEDHPLYGPIPYHPQAGYDLTFRPVLPPGAVRGDPARQRGFCPHCRPPRYFYASQELRCRRCGTAFAWPAEQQRHWYEVLRLSVAGRPPALCPRCRRERRAARELGQRLARAADDVRDNPDDVGALLELAAATAEHREKAGSGDLARGIAAARKAARLDPGAVTAHFWEAVCHDAAGRPERAADCYERFARLAGTRRTRSLRGPLERARSRLAELRAAGPAEDR